MPQVSRRNLLAAAAPFGTEQGERGRLNGGWGELRRRDGTVINVIKQ